MGKRVTVSAFRKKKAECEKIVMLTAYDAPSAAIATAAGVDLLLVGDSVTTAMLGRDNTISLTMEESLHHCKAVRRGAPEAFIIGDMPFMSFQANPYSALENAARYLKEADVDAVKIEGGDEIIELVAMLTNVGIPVMGHIGLLPQKVKTAGGYKVTGKTEIDVEKLIAEARALEEAGAFAVVLECMPVACGERISKSVNIPTIGIGAGVGCDGQVQVITDLLGLGTFFPKHSKQFANLNDIIKQAISQYVADVKSGNFPTEKQSF